MTIASHRYEIRDGLILRTFRPDDAEELCRAVDENRKHLRAWLPWVDANTEVEHFRLFIESTWKQYAEDKSFVCAVVLHDRIAGVAGYHAIRGQNRSVGLGYWLAEEVTGQGIMTACCRFLTDHAFTSLDINRVEIGVAVENTRSRAIPERLGFIQEGITRDAEWLYDHYVDHAMYAMLKRDWPTQKEAPCCPPNASSARDVQPEARRWAGPSWMPAANGLWPRTGIRTARKR